MGEVRVRKVDDWVVSWFRAQAKKNGKSLEGELREALVEIAKYRKHETAEDLRADLKAFEAKYGIFSDSALLIREERDRRG